MVNFTLTYNKKVDYQYTLEYMEKLVDDIRFGNADEEIMFLEHNHVYTAGISAKQEDLLDYTSIPIINTNRGGKYTYHGPGQRVVYLMLNLKNRNLMDIRKYVSLLENVIIKTILDLGIKAFKKEGIVGIWVMNKQTKCDEKIAALGIKLRHWIVFHGFAINFNPNLKMFKGIVPCGLSNYGVTSLEAHNIDISIKEFDVILKKNIEYIILDKYKFDNISS